MLIIIIIINLPLPQPPTVLWLGFKHDYLSIESNRKICRLQLGRLSIRKTTETMKPKSPGQPFRTRGRDEEDLSRSGRATSCPVPALGRREARRDPADQSFTGGGPVRVPAVHSEPRAGHQAAVHSSVSNHSLSLQLSSLRSRRTNKRRDGSTRLRRQHSAGVTWSKYSRVEKLQIPPTF